MTELQRLEAAYRSMYAAMIAKDCAALRRLLADDFVLVHMTGMRQGRSEFLQAIADGTLNYYSAQHEHIVAEVNGTEAVLCGQSRVNAAVFGGGRHTWRLRLDLRFVLFCGEWKISRAAASTY